METVSELYLRIVRRLRLRDLEALVALERTRSMTRTADQLAMTPPAVSKLLKEVEHAFGCKLFRRNTRNLTPTAEGELVIQHAKGILGGLMRVDADMQALRSGQPQTVRLGAPAALAATVLEQTVTQAEAQSQRYCVHLYEGATDVLLDKLERREIDLILARADETLLNAGCHFESLYEDSLTVAAAVDHPLRAQAALRWEHTLAYPWILPAENSQISRAMDLTLAAEGIAKPRALIVSTSSLLNALIARRAPYLYFSSSRALDLIGPGLGVAGLPLAVLSGPSRIGVFWLDDLTPSASAFVQTLKASLSTLGAIP